MNLSVYWLIYCVAAVLLTNALYQINTQYLHWYYEELDGLILIAALVVSLGIAIYTYWQLRIKNASLLSLGRMGVLVVVLYFFSIVSVFGFSAMTALHLYALLALAAVAVQVGFVLTVVF